MTYQFRSVPLLLGICVLLLTPPAVAQDGEKLADQLISPQDAGMVTGCGTAAGTRFNLEARPDAKAQHTTSVDVLRNQVAAGVDLIVGAAADLRAVEGSRTAYYVSRDPDCAPEFEGGLPPFDLLGEAPLVGRQGPAVAADPAREAFFIATFVASSNPDEFISGIGVLRSAAATLLNATACPAGTHSAVQAATCWPTKQLLAHEIEPFVFSDPQLAVDERTSGTGAGNVYVAFTSSTHTGVGFAYRLVLEACTNTLASCREQFIDSTIDSPIASPHVGVRPDGTVTVTWIELGTQILYRACIPAADLSLTCGPIRLVHTETQPLKGRLAAQSFSVGTYPRHDHREDANGVETYVVWDRCKVPLLTNGVCPDADVVMTASSDNGVTWSALTCVSCGPNDQFLPAIRTDRSRNIVNIAFYSSGRDVTFQHRLLVFIRHINPGGATSDPSDLYRITTLRDDPSGDPLDGGFGTAIGVAARGTGAEGQSRAYVHYTYHNIQGIYHGQQVPEPNNHLSRLDY